MAAMQYIKAAVGEHQRAGQGGNPHRELFKAAQLGFESRGGVHLIDVFK
jgi:hypothetical protein